MFIQSFALLLFFIYKGDVDLSLSVPVNLSADSSETVVNLSKSTEESSVQMITTVQDSAVKNHNAVHSNIPVLVSNVNQWSGGSAVIQNPVQGTKPSADNQVNASNQHSGSESCLKKVAVASQLYPVGKAFPIKVHDSVKTPPSVHPSSVPVQPKQAGEHMYAIKSNTSTSLPQWQVLTVVSCGPNSSVKSDVQSIQRSDTGASSSDISENIKQEGLTQPSPVTIIKDPSKTDVKMETTGSVLPRHTLKVTFYHSFLSLNLSLNLVTSESYG
jgi:hypothetical protein